MPPDNVMESTSERGLILTCTIVLLFCIGVLIIAFYAALVAVYGLQRAQGVQAAAERVLNDTADALADIEAGSVSADDHASQTIDQAAPQDEEDRGRNLPLLPDRPPIPPRSQLRPSIDQQTGPGLSGTAIPRQPTTQNNAQVTADRSANSDSASHASVVRIREGMQRLRAGAGLSEPSYGLNRRGDEEDGDGDEIELQELSSAEMTPQSGQASSDPRRIYGDDRDDVIWVAGSEAKGP